MAARNTLNKEIIDGVFEFAFESYNEEEQVYPQLFEVMNSTKAYEYGTDFVMHGDVEEVEEGEGNTDSQIVEGYTWYIKMRTLQASIPLTKEVVDDGRLDLSEIGRELGEQFAREEEIMAASIFNNGALTAGHNIFNTQVAGILADQFGNLIYDGQPFFDTAHPNTLGANTYSNFTASRTLSEANLETTLNTMEATNAYDNMDNPIKITADTLLIPKALRFTAAKILNSTLLPAVATNDVNPLQGILNPVVWRYLTDEDGWFTLTARKGRRWYNRSALSIGQEYDEKTRTYSIIFNKRVGVGVTNWRHAYACNISAT